jgi:hypothetical protein
LSSYACECGGGLFIFSSTYCKSIGHPRAETPTTKQATNNASANAWYARDYQFAGCHVLAFMFMCLTAIGGNIVGMLIGEKYVAPHVRAWCQNRWPIVNSYAKPPSTSNSCDNIVHDQHE